MSEPDEYQTRDSDPVCWGDFQELDETVGDLYRRVERIEQLLARVVSAFERLADSSGQS